LFPHWFDQQTETVAFVVPVKKMAQLIAMQGVVGGVEVQDDLLGRLVVHLQIHVDEEPLDVAVTGNDLLVSTRFVGTDRRQLQTIQRVATCQCLTSITFASTFATGQIVSPRQQCHQRIVPEFVTIVEVFVAKRNAHHALGEQLFDRVFDQFQVAMVTKTGGELPDHIERLVDFPPSIPLEMQRISITLCHDKTAPSVRCKCWFNNSLTSRRAVLLILLVRNMG